MSPRPCNPHSVALCVVLEWVGVHLFGAIFVVGPPAIIVSGRTPTHSLRHCATSQESGAKGHLEMVSTRRRIQGCSFRRPSRGGPSRLLLPAPVPSGSGNEAWHGISLSQGSCPQRHNVVEGREMQNDVRIGILLIFQTFFWFLSTLCVSSTRQLLIL